jgi:SAM-dependent methyltransferase
MLSEQTTANAEAIETWNTVLYDKFVRFRFQVTQGLGAHGEAAMARHLAPAGSRILDIGCGFGDTTLALARRVGPSGEAVGVDAAARFIETAQKEAITAGVANARYLVADVQSGELGGQYQSAFSRFGTMFFSAPVVALKTVRRALVEGARLTMVVWRRREDNPWVHLAEQRVRALIGEPPPSDAPTCGPGPFSMANADVVTDICLAAGFAEIACARFETDISLGPNVEEAVEFAMALGPAGEILRLAADAAKAGRAEVMAALRETFTPFSCARGVLIPSSSWIVTARAAALS